MIALQDKATSRRIRSQYLQKKMNRIDQKVSKYQFTVKEQ